MTEVYEVVMRAEIRVRGHYHKSVRVRVRRREGEEGDKCACVSVCVGGLGGTCLTSQWRGRIS